jgi:mRNA-degrading endonuclease RelE of RelBE toxin-antitoxin system
VHLHHATRPLNLSQVNTCNPRKNTRTQCNLQVQSNAESTVKEKTKVLTANVKALVNHGHQYRLCVGNFRVFFNFDGVIRIVSIGEVKKRDERTY